MPERQILLRALDSMGEDLRELEILYERYFSGHEKREPLGKRENLQRRLRQFVNRRIMQTDLRFRYETLAARYHSYSGYWDRILRLIDEGRYERHLGNKTGLSASGPPRPSPSQGNDEAAYQQLLKAHQSCNPDKTAPSRQQFSSYLAKQRSALSEKFGDREIEFRITTEGGKPRITARPKKQPSRG